MRSLFTNGVESMSAPTTSDSMTFSSLIPSIGRLMRHPSHSSGESRRGVDSEASSSVSSPSAEPSTQRLDRILNESDGEDEERGESGGVSGEGDASRARVPFARRSDVFMPFPVRTRRETLADLVHSHSVGSGTLGRRSTGGGRTFNPFRWSEPNVLEEAPADRSLPPALGASVRLGELLGGRQPQPPEEIDLTISSDTEDENEQDGAWSSSQAPRPTSVTGVAALTDGEDGDVQIIGSTGESAPSLRRKRRRTLMGDGAVTKRARGGFDPNTAESTNISMENNDAIEQFKHALKCSICLDQMTDMTSTMCGHVFCARCITAQVRINGKCPLCQRRLQLKDIHPLFF